MKKNIIKYMLDLLLPYKSRVIIISCCMIIVSALGIISPLMQKNLFDNGIMSGNINIVVKYTIIILIIYLFEQLFEFIQFRHYVYVNKHIPADLLRKALEHSINLKVSYHKDNNFSKTINNVYNDISNITRTIDASFLQMGVSFFKIIGGIIGLCIISWKLTLFILIIVPLELLINSFISSRRVKYTKIFMKLNENFSVWFSETFKNIEIIKLWNLHVKRKNEFNILKEDMIQAETKLDFFDNYNQMINSTLGFIYINGLNLLGALLILKDGFTIGGLFAFTSYSMYVLQPIALLVNIIYKLSSSIPAFERFIEYFNNDVENYEGISIATNNNYEVNNITFKDIIFGYKNKDSILNSINFSIKKGEKIAFVGSNGSGKTSIINLMLRFFEPTSGNIKLNDIDIQDIALSEYRDLFCVMNQNINLFDGTIKENINILNNLSDDQINYYLDVATAFEYVNSLPDGVDSFVGFNGSKLSGGEKQKISLARTLTKKGRILILDEATANFDLMSERNFNKYIIQNDRYDIIIIISHREDILKEVDKIFLIDNGIIVDSGSYMELSIKNDYFNKILEEEKDNDENCD